MIKQRYIKTRASCKLTFLIPENELPDDIEIDHVAVVGSFNNWDRTHTPMKRTSKGVYKAVVEVEPGQEILFRFLANDEVWFNAWEPDSYTPNPYGSDDCVVQALDRPE